MAAGYFASRSRIMNLMVVSCPASSRSVTRFLITWVTQAWVGWAVVPSTRTPRRAWWMAAKDVLALPGEGDGLDEVHREDGFGLGVKEGGPGDVRALGRGIDAFGLEDFPDGGGCQFDAEECEFAVDAPVAPGGVLLGEAEYEAADGSDCAGAARTPFAAETGMTAVHEVAVPAQDGVRGDDESEPAQGGSWQRGEECGQEGAVGLLKAGALVAESALQDGELVTEREDLGVLVVVAHRDQPQGGEGVGDGDAGQAYEHGQ